jgi:hypothetical protein
MTTTPLFLLIAETLKQDGSVSVVTLASADCSPATGTGLVALGLPEGTVFDGIVEDKGGPITLDSSDTGLGTASPIEKIKHGSIKLNMGASSKYLMGRVWTDQKVECWRVEVDSQSFPQNPDISNRVLEYKATMGSFSRPSASNGYSMVIDLKAIVPWTRQLPQERYYGLGDAIRFSGGKIAVSPATRFKPGTSDFRITFRARNMATDGVLRVIFDYGDPVTPELSLVRISWDGIDTFYAVVFGDTGNSGSGSITANPSADFSEWTTFIATVDNTSAFINMFAFSPDWSSSTDLLPGPIGVVGVNALDMSIGAELDGSRPYIGDLDEVYIASGVSIGPLELWQDPETNMSIAGAYRMNSGIGSIAIDSGPHSGGGSYLECLPGIANAGNILPGAFGGDFSVACTAWMESDGVRDIFRKFDTALGSIRGFRFVKTSAPLRVVVNIGDGTSVRIINYDIAAGEDVTFPAKYTMTVNRSTEEVCMYRNAEYIGSADITGLGSFLTTADLRIGAATAASNGMNGVSDFVVYDRAITASEVASISLGRAADRVPSGIVGYWPLDDGSGVTAADIVGSNDATLQGSATWQTNNGAISTVGVDAEWIGSGTGSPSLRGELRRSLRGDHTAASGKLIDSRRSVYEVSTLGCDSVIPAINGDRTGLTSIGDVADIYSVSPGPGQYATSTVGPTCVRFGFSVAGQPAFDVVNGGGVQLGMEIIEDLFLSSGINPDDILDSVSRAQILDIRPEILRLVTGDREMQLFEPVSDVLSTMRAYMVTDMINSRLVTRVIDKDFVPDLSITIDDVDAHSISLPKLSGVPEASVTVVYDRRAVSWDFDTSDPSLSADVREDASRDSLVTAPTSARNPIAVAVGSDVRWETLIRYDIDARVAGDRRIQYSQEPPAFFEVMIYGYRDVLISGVDVEVDFSVDGVDSTGIKPGSVWRVLRVRRPLDLDAVHVLFWGRHSDLGDIAID